jgi:hypothetical protein
MKYKFRRENKIKIYFFKKIGTELRAGIATWVS